MSIDDIVFNPYEDTDRTEQFSNIIEGCLQETQPNLLMEQIASRLYFDSTMGWNKLLNHIVIKYKLAPIIGEHYKSIISKHQDEIIPQFTYMITTLISSNLVSTDIITKEIVDNINDDSKFILMSFLASWDLTKALELDSTFISNNFNHILEANAFPIRDIILNANIDMYYSIAQSVLEDTSVQYHFNQEIQKIIKKENEEELNKLELFLDLCMHSQHEFIIEFVCDLLELSTIQTFLKERWNITLTERIYNNFLSIKNFLSHDTKDLTISSINRFKKKQTSSLALAARHQISKLSEEDRLFILKTIEGISSQPITDYFDKIILPSKDSWNWKDYAYSVVGLYKKMHTDEEVINLDTLCKDLGFKLIVTNFKTDNFDACLVRDSSLTSPIIMVNSSKKSVGRINFSIAHEIAHAVIRHHANTNFFCFIDDVTESNRFIMDRELEKEANMFASYILLPDRQFKEDISRLNFTFQNVEELSKKYRSSLVLVAKKWVEQSNLEIAMVFSTGGTIDWATTSETFPFSWVNHVDKLSSVFKAIETDEKISIRKTVPSKNWFENDNFRYTLLEESFKIFDNKVLTLLQILDEE